MCSGETWRSTSKRNSGNYILEAKMIIKEYKLVSSMNDGTFPVLEVVKEYDFEPLFDMYVFNNNDNYEYELSFFGEQIELQNNYVEYFYVMSYNEIGEVIGVLKISSGSRRETAIPYDTLFTYLLLTGSYSFITIHNHPNNNPEKSIEDIQSDEHLKQIAGLLNITYRDGLIITKKQVDDFRQTAWKEDRADGNAVSRREGVQNEQDQSRISAALHQALRR